MEITTMDLVSDLGMINPNIAAEQLSPNATTSTASSGIESFLSNPSGLSILPQSDDGANGGIDEKEDRPSLSYKDLIVEAIESSPEKRLKLSEIYQVIKYLHPYYRKRPDQWGWQNSIRHNLSLHDCFVKLPLKQSSASGVVGHFWTVVRDREDKNGSSRRRNRGSTNRLGNRSGCKISVASAPATTSLGKGKDRQSVSSDSGVLSDESQASSPTSTQIPDYANPFLSPTSTYGNQFFASALHRPMPSYTAPTTIPSSPTKPFLDNSTNPALLPLLGRLALQSLVDNNAYANSQNTLANSLQRIQLLQLLYQQNLAQQMAEEQQQQQANQSPVTALLAQMLLNSSNPGVDMASKLQSPSVLDLLLQPTSLPSNPSFPSTFDPSPLLSSTPSLTSLLEQQLRNSLNNVAMTSPTPTAKDVVMI